MLEFLDEMVDETVVKVFSTKMGITSSHLHFKNTLINDKEQYIKSYSTKVEDEDVMFLLVKTVHDCNSSGLVDDLKNVHPQDGTGILC